MKFKFVVIALLILFAGYWLFSIGVILFKILIGLGVLILFSAGAFIGYHIGKSNK